MYDKPDFAYNRNNDFLNRTGGYQGQYYLNNTNIS